MVSPRDAEAVKSRWEAQKAKLKLRFPQLNDVDLNFEVTRRNEMLTKLQVKTGRTAKELQAIMQVA